jgi:hypothetical protein
MPALLQPAVACKLLLTAAARNRKAANHLVRLPYMQQHVDVETFQAMLQQLIREFGGPDWDFHAMEMTVRLLCSLPAAQQLSSEAAEQVILAFVQHDCDITMPAEFYSLPGVQQLSDNQVMRLLAADPEHQLWIQ